MNAGSGFGADPEAEGSSRRAADDPVSGRSTAGRGARHEATFADVLNGLTLDSGRGGRRRRHKARQAKHDASLEDAEIGDHAARTAAPDPLADPGGDSPPVEQRPVERQGGQQPGDQPAGDQHGHDQAERAGLFPEAGLPQEAGLSGGDLFREDGLTGGAGDYAWPETESPDEPDPAPEVPNARHAEQEPSWSPPSWEDEFDDSLDATAMVRPYAWTGGRTKANYELELETLVSSTEQAFGDDGPVQVEHRSMVDLCRQPRSVAEIAALLGVPLGVARVLISDVADLGLATVHHTTSGDEDGQARLTLMERVLSGLRRL